MALGRRSHANRQTKSIESANEMPHINLTAWTAGKARRAPRALWAPFKDSPGGKVLLGCFAAAAVVPFLAGGAEALGLHEQVGALIVSIADVVLGVGRAF